MSTYVNGISNTRSQSSDGESLPDDVFHDDTTVGGASCHLTPPTTSSAPPPKPPRVGGSSGGIASFISKNSKMIRESSKRTSSESELEGADSVNMGSESTSDVKVGGGRMWSFKGGQGARQQSVPVDVHLAGSRKIDPPMRKENGSTTSFTGNDSCLTSSMSVSPQPLQTDEVETTPTNSVGLHPPRLATSSSTHSSTLDLETVHEGVESTPPTDVPPPKPGRKSPSNRKVLSGTPSGSESKPSPKPRHQQKQPRTKHYSDSQVFTDDSKSSKASKEEDDEKGAGAKKKKGPDTLERDNMLLREQIKLLKGQNKKLKKENKKIKSKLEDSGEWDLPTSPSTQSESATPSESPQSSRVSSRVPSESPSREVPERTRLQKSESPPLSGPLKKEVENVTSGKGSSTSNAKELEESVKEEGEDLNIDEANDVPGSLPVSGVKTGAGAGIRSSSVPSMFTANKPKPIPIPRSGTVSVSACSDVVKANEDRTTRGFVLKRNNTDIDALPSNVETVKLESDVAKPDSPVPKPRGVKSPPCDDIDKDKKESEKAPELGVNNDSNKAKEKEKLKAIKTLEILLPHTHKPTPAKPTPIPRTMSAREEETAKKEPLMPRAASTSPVRKVGTVTLGSVVAKNATIPEDQVTVEEEEEGSFEANEGVKEERGSKSSEDRGKERDVMTRSSSDVRTVGETSKDSSVKVDSDEDERTASVTSNRSFTSSTSSVKLSMPITKPLPPTPIGITKPPPPATASSTAKPLPLTLPTNSKPLPLTPPTITKPPTSTPSSSSAKPLPPTPTAISKPPPPPTPTSSNKPLPLTPPTIAKPLPPAPYASSSAKSLPPASSSTKPLPPTPIKVGVSSSSATPLPSITSPPPSAGVKELSGSISPKTPTTRSTVTGYKKVTIQADTSWLNRRKHVDKETTDGSNLEPPPTPGGASGGTNRPPGGSVSSTSGSQSPATSRSHAPYRSHPILPGPSPTSGKTFLSPGTTELKPGPTTKLPPPKLLSSRTRTESVSLTEQSPKKPTGGKNSWESELLRSTSEENFVSQSSTKVKSKGGFFSRNSSSSKKDPPLPKKPSKPWLRKDKGSPPSARPMSALVANPTSPDGRNFTSSCNVSTMPRGTQQEEGNKYSPKGSRRKKAASEQDLYNGSPGRKSRGILGRFKNRHSGAPPLEEEAEDDVIDSSSDDEKGGTIKFKPKLRHVSQKKTLSFDDDSEPEYHQLFEYVFVVGLKEKSGASNKGKLTTELTYNFPPASDSAKKDLALQSIPQFCFPDVDQWKPVKEYKSESFSFVLTDMEGHRRYGYCRRLLPQGSGKRLPEVYCIVSPLGCFSLYEKILDHVEERRSMATAVSVFTFLKAIVANPFPRPGRSVQVPVISARGTGMETVVFERPIDSRLEHVDFSLLFNTLSQRKVIQVFSSLLMERRVILVAQSLSLLSGCAHALLALLYPFEWQHVFIPVLPGSLIDFVCSPLPYIIGINPSCVKQIESMETMEEALIVDLDKKKFVRKIGDETSILPTKLFQFLEHSLSSALVTGEYSKKSSDVASRSRADQIVVNTFMTFFAYLYGDYKSFLRDPPSGRGEKEFQRIDFVKKFSSKSTKRFLEAFQMTQMFENFIEQRENPNKEAMVAESLFEKKIPTLSRGCQEIEIFSSKSRFDRWRIKKGLVKS